MLEQWDVRTMGCENNGMIVLSSHDNMGHGMIVLTKSNLFEWFNFQHWK